MNLTTEITENAELVYNLSVISVYSVVNNDLRRH
jgi:hypothetical protein